MAKRESQFIIRVNDREKEVIKENAKKAQLTVSEYIRVMAIYGEVK